MRNLLCGLVTALAASAPAGQWLVPDTDQASSQGLERAVFMGRQIDEAPCLYRGVLRAPRQFDAAAASLRSSGWAYVWIDGKPVSGRREGNDQDAARNRLLNFEFADLLVPGQLHVIVVSAPPEGFVLDGAFFNDFNRVDDIASDVGWTVTRYAGGAVLEDQPIMTLAYDGKAVGKLCSAAGGVRAVDLWKVEDRTLLAVAGRMAARRIYDRALDQRRRLTMLIETGDLEIDGRRSRWFGLVSTEPITLRRAEYRLGKLGETLAGLKGFLAESARPAVDRRAMRSAFAVAAETMDETDAWLAELAAARRQRQRELTAQLTSRIQIADPYARPTQLNRASGRLDWPQLPEMFDADIDRWGIRINPVDPELAGRGISLDGPWKFVIDPRDSGLVAGFFTRNKPDEIAAWPQRAVPHNWARDDDPGVAAHKGAAWYTRRFSIPSAWAGLTVQLKMTVEGDERVWVNGREVTHLATGYRKRTFQLPPEVLAYGSENSIFVRVDSSGPYRGLAGKVWIDCPTITSSVGTETPPVSVAATPLSPLVILRPRTNIIQIRHTGTAALAIPQDGTVHPSRNYDRVEHRKLAENWVVLWLHPRSAWDVVRPIQLIFQHNPRSIRCLKGVTEIKLDGQGELVMAVRPWSRTGLTFGDSQIDLLNDARLWSRLARAVPVNFLSIPRELQGDKVAHEIAYDYLVSEDDWSVAPLYVAPLPGGASMAMNARKDAVAVPLADKLVTLHDGRAFGAYRAIMDAKGLSYVCDKPAIKPLWALSCEFPMTDASDRACELAKSLGLNALRWEHRWKPEGGTIADVAASLGAPSSSADGRARPVDMAASLGLAYIHAAEGIDKLPESPVTRARGEAYLTAVERDILSRVDAFKASGIDVALEICPPPTEADCGKRFGVLLAAMGALDIEAPLLLSPHPAETHALAGQLAGGDSGAVIADGVRLDLSIDRRYVTGSERLSDDVDPARITEGFRPLLLEAASRDKYLYCSYLGFGLEKDAPALPAAAAETVDLLDQFDGAWSFARAGELFILRDDGSIAISETAKAIADQLRRINAPASGRSDP